MSNRWSERTLGEVSDFQGGSQPPKSQFIDSPSEGYVRLLQIRDFKSDNKAIYIPVSQKNKICSADDIMLARYGASVGQIHRGKGGAYNVALIRTIPDDSIIDRDFYYYYLTSSLFQIPLLKVAGSRAAQAGFSKLDIVDFPISLPSLLNQKRIVAILGEAFAGISQAVVNAEKNLANARELFESYLNNIFAQKGDGWEEKKLGDVADFKNGINYSKSSRGQTISVVGVGDFQNNFYAPVDDLGSVTVDGELNANYEIKKDDILTVRSNGSKALIGRCMLVPQVKQQTSYSGFIIRIRLDGTVIAPKFFLWFMKSKSTVDRLTGDGGGANINNINQKILSALPLRYPCSLREQVEIVELIDEMSAASKKLEFIYQQKLLTLAELKQSILQKAFTGELISDNVLQQVNG